MSPLRLVKPKPQQPVTAQVLVDLLHPDHFDDIERTIRLAREQFSCPLTVPDYEAFKTLVYEYFAHLTKALFNADYKQPSINQQTARYHAYDFWERLLGRDGMHHAERQSITGREGGAITIIDALTEKLLTNQIEQYCHGVFVDYIAPSDYATKLRLTEELIRRVGPVLLPGEVLLHTAILANDVEGFYKTYINHVHPLRRAWRY